jgi:uncharacterized protein involved in exopolysaccharide biosynthesis
LDTRNERAIMATIESFVDKSLEKLEAQLELWSARVGELRAKAKVTGQQAKIDSRQELDELKSKLEAARAKLDEAKAAGSEKWGALKHGVEQTWEELEGAFKKLIH